MSKTDADLTSWVDEAVEEAVYQLTERLEYHLLGAWRAGYDYLHVYDDPMTEAASYHDPTEEFAIRYYVVEGYTGDPRPDPPGLVYRYSYDLTSVPDEVIREAIRDE